MRRVILFKLMGEGPAGKIILVSEMIIKSPFCYAAVFRDLIDSDLFKRESLEKIYKRI